MSSTVSRQNRQATDSRRGTAQADRARVRAAWMYYAENQTQGEIARQLGIGRVTVARLLADARAQNEVQITLHGQLAELTELERSLEARFALQRALVAPLVDARADPVPVISTLAGEYLSGIMQAGMRVGVGWGRTLHATLPAIERRALPGFQVISLLGGIMQARRFNPAEFAWQFAEVFQGEGFLIPAPAIVDSRATRDSLVNRCGIDAVFAMAEQLDCALLSVGGITTSTTSYQVGYLSDQERRGLGQAGAVGDLLFHFFDRDGQLVEHEINERIMAVSLESVRKITARIMVSGGPEKLDALAGVMALVEPTVLITDEVTARALLARGRS